MQQERQAPDETLMAETETVEAAPTAMMAGGGLIVEAAGSIVAGIGVSGAPGGDLDENCAKVGIESIIDQLEF